MDVFWAMLLKPFIGLVFLVLIYGIAALLHRVIPEGKLKERLYSPLFVGKKKGRG